MNTSKTIILLAAALMAAGCHCNECDKNKDNRDRAQSNSNGADQASMNDSMTDTSAKMAADDTSPMAKDGEILATLVAIDQHEVDAAVVAQRKNVNPAVSEFAKEMQAAHTSHRDETIAAGQKLGISMNNSDKVEQMKKHHQDDLEKLSLLEGNEFAREYMDAMVKGHTKVLEKIDNTMMKRVVNENLRTHLSKTRDVVAQHLEHAKSVQSGLPKS